MGQVGGELVEKRAFKGVAPQAVPPHLQDPFTLAGCLCLGLMGSVSSQVGLVPERMTGWQSSPRRRCP
jgi:hypothetical protein